MASERKGGDANQSDSGSGQEEHLRGVSDKEQRTYEHVKESYEGRGVPEDEAKERAARTVMKHHGEEGHETGE